MKKYLEKFYCDRCGSEMTWENHDSEKYFVSKIYSEIGHLCPKCYEEYEPKEQELLNWLTMDGCAFKLQEIARKKLCPLQEH